MRIKVETDVAVLAQEAQREPALGLAAIASAQRNTHQLGRQIVGQPVRMLADDLSAIGADLFGHFTQHRAARILARINTALRQLPAARCPLSVWQVGAPGDEYAAVAVEQHSADIRTIGQGAHCCAGGCTSALTGARARPSATRLVAQAASRWIVTGRAAA